MKARDAVLMVASMLVASAILKAFPAMKNFVAAHSITVRDAKGNTLYDAI
jgi:hypothetical protein